MGVVGVFVGWLVCGFCVGMFCVCVVGCCCWFVNVFRFLKFSLVGVVGGCCGVVVGICGVDMCGVGEVFFFGGVVCMVVGLSEVMK